MKRTGWTLWITVPLSLAACAGQSGVRPGAGGASGIRQERKGQEVVTEHDLNHDGKPDVFSYTVAGKNSEGKAVQTLVRKEMDINWDGRIDIHRTYAEKETIAQESLDLDFDGRVDQTNFYEKGAIVRKERDLDYNGKPDEWLFYERGKLTRKERDSNGDARVDYWEYWENDAVDRIGEDLDGDGKVDRWSKSGPPTPQ